MSPAARSLVVFGVCLAVLGAILVLMRNLLLGAFGVPPTREVWFRAAGAIWTGVALRRGAKASA